MSKKWILKEQINANRADEIDKKFHTGEIVSKIICNMNFKDDEEIKKFLNPKRSDFYDPFLMPDMEKAVDRIEKAIQNREDILIYGDYDADGVTSTTVLKRFFSTIKINVKTYIPNRLEEGYGLNKNAIKKIADEGINLIITVDCGITAVEETKYAKELGMDVIITDHHEPADEIPNEAVAVIDCKRKESTYPFRELCGCGVAFKLTQALCKRLNLNENNALKYLDLVCVGTISDVVPLVDENRVIAKLGLMLLKQTKNLGLKYIINNAHFKDLNSTSVAFGITPRINACGRLGHQDEALELFTTDDENKAKELAEKVNLYNAKRQEEEKRIYEEALEMLEEETAKKFENKTQYDEIEQANKIDKEAKNEPLEQTNAKNSITVKEKCIILGKENWNSGIIGIVSSRITEKFYKPSILICFDEENAKGSGRSIDGFDLHKALMDCSKYLTNFGGHSQAAGLSLKTNDFENFKEMFEKYAEKNIDDESLIQKIEIDLEVNKNQINIENVENLKLLEPFGQSNEEPIFIYKNLEIQSIRTLSDGKHLKLFLKDSSKEGKIFYMDSIGFNLGERQDEIKVGDKIDIVGNLSINEYNNLKSVQFILRDFRIAEK